jgi:hypothetical protein
MSDDDSDKAATSGAPSCVKAGVAVGIGSAAIVAALLYASKVKKPEEELTASRSRPYHSSSRISWS